MAEEPETPEAPEEPEESKASEVPESTEESGEYEPSETPKAEAASFRRRHWRKITLLLVLLVPLFLFAAWAAITLNYAFSTGERAGFAQKLSHRGWVCKTWEGELAMVNLPGAMPEIFRFSVRNDSIARLLERNLGKRVSLSYEQHRGVPTSCFGETEYYITNVRLLDP
jgi:hypothetical protein